MIAISAAATAETSGEEKRKAFEIYIDLVARLDNLIQIGVGKAVASPSIPSASDSTWISVPITFFANRDAAQEWQTKFRLIADKHDQIAINVAAGNSFGNSPTCPIPRMIGISREQRDARNVTNLTFLGKAPGSGQNGVAACFVASATPSGVVADCFGRAFVTQAAFTRSLIAERAQQLRLNVEFFDQNGSAVYLVQVPFREFPSIAVDQSRPEPGGSTAFFNYCAGNNQSLFFKVFRPGAWEPHFGFLFGDIIIFPPPTSRINATLNVLMPNDKIGQIDKVRVTIKSNAKIGEAR